MSCRDILRWGLLAALATSAGCYNGGREVQIVDGPDELGLVLVDIERPPDGTTRVRVGDACLIDLHREAYEGCSVGVWDRCVGTRSGTRWGEEVVGECQIELTSPPSTLVVTDLNVVSVDSVYISIEGRIDGRFQRVTLTETAR